MQEAGPDRIRNEVLIERADIVSHTLTQLFNVCLRERKFPDACKVARIVLIYKCKGKDSNDPKSYRTASLMHDGKSDRAGNRT